jgi:hypothetical protein
VIAADRAVSTAGPAVEDGPRTRREAGGICRVTIQPESGAPAHLHAARAPGGSIDR